MTTLPEQAAEYVQPSATAGTRELCAEHDAQHLGLAPEREGQPRMMTIIDRAQDDETGHWYSPEAVREIQGLLDAVHQIAGELARPSGI